MTARGYERRKIFRDARDRAHFLKLLGQLPERFGTRLDAYVLMAAAVGAEVTVLSRSPHRDANARRLGVDRFLQTTNESR
jgi:hypothetical protein